MFVEVALAVIHPTYDSRLEQWGSIATDFAIGIGIVGEVLFSMLDSRIQTELRSRSNKRVAEATERAANAEQETERLRAATSWRRLPPKEHKALVLALKDSGPGASVQFCVLANDAESLYFAQQISIPFRVAGWQAGYRYESYLHEIFTGIFLPETRDNWFDEIKGVNSRVREAFIAAEIPFVNGWPSAYTSTNDNTRLRAPVAWVYIGPKPMPQD